MKMKTLIMSSNYCYTYSRVRVFVTIRIDNRNNVPVMLFSDGSDLWVSAC